MSYILGRGKLGHGSSFGINFVTHVTGHCLYFTVMEIRVATMARWLYHRGDCKARFDCSQFMHNMTYLYKMDYI